MITQTARNISFLALALTVLGLMSSCASRSPDPVARPQPAKSTARSPSIGDKAAAVALQQVGVPYKYGGSTTSGFDCSGLVQFSYRRAGKDVPRTTGQLWSSTTTVRHNDLQAGDLLFFSIEGKMSHVGMYVGRQQFVHAPSSGRTVTVENMSAPFYASALLRAGRPK